MKTKRFQFGLVLLSIFYLHQLSYADGVFIPQARKKLPDIPFQRAIVKYREGTEALIVESSLSGKGGDYGWLIPVPSPPKKFEKVSPGLLKTISLQIQPQIHQRIPNPKAFGLDIAANQATRDDKRSRILFKLCNGWREDRRTCIGTILVRRI